MRTAIITLSLVLLVLLGALLAVLFRETSMLRAELAGLREELASLRANATPAAYMPAVTLPSSTNPGEVLATKLISALLSGGTPNASGQSEAEEAGKELGQALTGLMDGMMDGMVEGMTAKGGFMDQYHQSETEKDYRPFIEEAGLSPALGEEFIGALLDVLKNDQRKPLFFTEEVDSSVMRAKSEEHQRETATMFRAAVAEILSPAQLAAYDAYVVTVPRRALERFWEEHFDHQELAMGTDGRRVLLNAMLEEFPPEDDWHWEDASEERTVERYQSILAAVKEKLTPADFAGASAYFEKNLEDYRKQQEEQERRERGSGVTWKSTTTNE